MPQTMRTPTPAEALLEETRERINAICHAVPTLVLMENYDEAQYLAERLSHLITTHAWQLDKVRAQQAAVRAANRSTRTAGRP